MPETDKLKIEAYDMERRELVVQLNGDPALRWNVGLPLAVKGAPPPSEADVLFHCCRVIAAQVDPDGVEAMSDAELLDTMLGQTFDVTADLATLRAAIDEGSSLGVAGDPLVRILKSKGVLNDADIERLRALSGQV